MFLILFQIRFVLRAIFSGHVSPLFQITFRYDCLEEGVGTLIKLALMSLNKQIHSHRRWLRKFCSPPHNKPYRPRGGVEV